MTIKVMRQHINFDLISTIDKETWMIAYIVEVFFFIY